MLGVATFEISLVWFFKLQGTQELQTGYKTVFCVDSDNDFSGRRVGDQLGLP